MNISRYEYRCADLVNLRWVLASNGVAKPGVQRGFETWGLRGGAEGGLEGGLGATGWDAEGLPDPGRWGRPESGSWIELQGRVAGSGGRVGQDSWRGEVFD